jgi:hypothetical protein
MKKPYVSFLTMALSSFLRANTPLSQGLMMDVTAPIQPNRFHLQVPPTSNLGNLDVLPSELIQLTLNDLDFRSLFRLGAVSHRGREVVQSHRAFRDLIMHAYPTLVALGRTELLQWHSSASLCTTLQSEACVSCSQYEPLIFSSRPANDVATRAFITIYHFGLNSEDFKSVPILRTIPRTGLVPPPLLSQNRLELVSVKSTKRIALAIHGSEEALSGLILDDRDSSVGSNLRRSLVSASVEPLEKDMSMYFLPLMHKPMDMFSDMGSILYPSLSVINQPENGHWCKGCQQEFQRFTQTGILDSKYRHQAPDVEHAIGMLMWQVHQARSRTKFLQHVKVCIGVGKLQSEVKSEDSSTAT